MFGPDDRLRETAFMAVCGFATAIVSGYLGFASWDDRNYLRHLRGVERGGPEPPETQ